MLAVGEHVVLIGQVGAARVHQIDTRQIVLLRHFLRAQVLLHRHRVVGAALHRGVVAHDHAVHAVDAADAGDHASARSIVVVHVERSQRRELQERRARIEQTLHALARQQLAARHVFGARGLAATLRHALGLCAQIVDHRLHRIRVGLEVRRPRVELRSKNAHCLFLHFSLFGHSVFFTI
ncbi:hypothetical protein SDC9_121200 [bioreactor metagenome]|uniref:Uncharacterized protein n=1 Tax=bioreactor metagenome TaxID=1076179 RepID=A0A645CBB8_9ZZZZ